MENPPSSSINSLLANFLSKLKFNLNDYVQCRNERVDHDDASLIANTISHSESSTGLSSKVKALPEEFVTKWKKAIPISKGPDHERRWASKKRAFARSFCRKADSQGTRRLSLFVTESILIFVQYHKGWKMAIGYHVFPEAKVGCATTSNRIKRWNFSLDLSHGTIERGGQTIVTQQNFWGLSQN